jgi:hypothetical protein
VSDLVGDSDLGRLAMALLEHGFLSDEFIREAVAREELGRATVRAYRGV